MDPARDQVEQPAPDSGTAATRRAPTVAEARALAHPLRLRILRLCLGTPRTNKQLADLLGEKPGSLHHHVRTLVDTGFLAATDVRQGSGGALEKPYLATGKSWTLDVGEGPGEDANVSLAMLDAFRAELVQAGSEATKVLSRLGLRLDEASVDELRTRLSEVVEEFAGRPPDPGGAHYSLMVALHRQPAREEAGDD